MASKAAPRVRKTPRVARTFKFPPGLIERYEARAAQLGMNRTAFVERALEAALGGDTPRPSPAGREAKTEAATTPARPAAASPQSASRSLAPPRASVAASAPVRPPVRTDALPNRADAFRSRTRT